jgi:hypothetical protein
VDEKNTPVDDLLFSENEKKREMARIIRGIVESSFS